MKQTTAFEEHAHHAELANRDEADALRNGQTVSLLQRLRAWWAGDDGFRLPVLQVSHMRQVQVKAGDVLVVTTDKSLTMEQRESLRACIAAQVPWMKVLVLEGVRVGVISPPASN